MILVNPETYSEIFDDLKKNDIINKDVAEKLVSFVGLRNLLGHLYTKIDNEKVYEIIQEDLDVFYSFKNQILKKFKENLE